MNGLVPEMQCFTNGSYNNGITTYCIDCHRSVIISVFWLLTRTLSSVLWLFILAVRLWEPASRSCKARYRGHNYPVWGVDLRYVVTQNSSLVNRSYI